MSDERLRVLIVDDQEAVRQALSVLFDLHGIPSVSAGDAEEALAAARRERLGAVVQDMNFARNETSGAQGAELFRALREAQPGLPVVLMTAWASLETAVELVREGAADYVEKPWKDDKLVATVANFVRLRELEGENERLRRELGRSREDLAREHDLRGLVYESEAMHRLLALAVQVAPSDAPVLVTGPSGVGKERIAEVVQANSRRRGEPFVRVNVGALAHDLLEAELFGAEAGSYTGQKGRREGVFQAADGGTLFLDEIDSLPPAGQVKLLRVLQTGEVQRIGSPRPAQVDVRVISATNADLSASLAAGRFREDLFFRLNVVELALPPLAERVRDVLPLARHFLARFSADEGLDRRFSAAAEATLVEHDWPGNVRELENRVQRATLLAGGDTVEPADLGFGREGRGVEDREWSGEELAERDELLRVLGEEEGVVARAAERLELSRQALYRKMARLGVEVERRPKG
ncbi:MAG: sigma-54 dependent transcriptional regulator [Thermoanaerobaculia bacterium]